MFALLKFCFFCLLAVAAGVFAVSIPVAGRTPAEHVRRLVHQVAGAPAAPPTARPPATSPRRTAPRPAPASARKAEARRPADDHTAQERAALDELIGMKTRQDASP